MALKQFRPVTPGTRLLVLIDRSGLWKGRPEKSLTRGKVDPAGRNSSGNSASSATSISAAASSALSERWSGSSMIRTGQGSSP